MTKVWTAISYNWILGQTHVTIFRSAFDSTLALAEFEKLYPGEDLIALVPGQHDAVRSYPLTGGQRKSGLKSRAVKKK